MVLVKNFARIGKYFPTNPDGVCSLFGLHIFKTSRGISLFGRITAFAMWLSVWLPGTCRQQDGAHY
jgi:hypothetical protein